MGIATAETVTNKRRYAGYLRATQNYANEDHKSALRDIVKADAAMNLTQPFNRIEGVDNYIEVVVDPLNRAFAHLTRRTDMLFGGEYDGCEWLVSHGHFVGEFRKNWLGIPASGTVIWLQTVQYLRMENGLAIESYQYFDMHDLLRQIGRAPIQKSLGFEGFVPGPAIGDGILCDEQSAQDSETSLRMVDDMLRELWTEEERWRDYWHPDMLWYGPSGYGSQIGIEGFERFQLPYESMFAPGSYCGQMKRSGRADLDNKVRGHFARFGDGNLVASGGWPSHGGIMNSDWIGIKANGQPFTVRVADIWRRENNLLVENWVFVDLVDMALQLGRDLFADAGIQITL